MGVWDESSLFSVFVQHAHLTDQSTMLSGFVFPFSLVYVSLLLYLYVAILPSPFLQTLPPRTFPPPPATPFPVYPSPFPRFSSLPIFPPSSTASQPPPVGEKSRSRSRTPDSQSILSTRPIRPVMQVIQLPIPIICLLKLSHVGIFVSFSPYLPLV